MALAVLGVGSAVALVLVLVAVIEAVVDHMDDFVVA